MLAPLDLLGLTSEALASEARARVGKGAGVWREIYQDAMLRAAFAPEEHGVSDAAALAWRAGFSLALPEVVRVIEEETPFGPTRKAVLRLHDGLEIECVAIPMARDRTTLCISSQVGCKMGCTFCETGRMGLLRNLSAGEIVAQVVVTQAVLGWSIGNVVYMGMGEALDNADALLQSLRVLADLRGLRFGQQRITVCTVGHAAGLERLAELGWPRLNVALSLNATTDASRSALMPINKKTPLDALIAAFEAYRPRRNFVLALNYCLLPGLNDRREDATRLAAIAARLGRALINLIPYNPGTQPITRAPSEEEIEGFLAWLEEEGAPVRRRKTKGRSVMAACGQLGNVELRRRRAG